MPRRAVLALLWGCGHAAPPPSPVAIAAPAPADAAVPIDAPLDEDLPQLAAREVALYAGWERALAEANGDCAAAAAKIDALADASADVIAANAKILGSDHDRIAALRAALEPHAAELDASAKAIVHSSTMAACHDDPAFARAIDRLGGQP